MGEWRSGQRAPLYLTGKAEKELYADLGLAAVASRVYICAAHPDRVFAAVNLETGEAGVILTEALPSPGPEKESP